jgi:hypothetical protein
MIVAEGNLVIVHGRFSGFGAPASWIAADILVMEEGVLVEHWDSLKTKQHVRSPRAGIRCSAVHFPDRYIRDLDRRLSARGQTVNCFERKEFSLCGSCNS